jgi:plastocyanin
MYVSRICILIKKCFLITNPQITYFFIEVLVQKKTFYFLILLETPREMISDKHISDTLLVMGLIITISLVGITLANSNGPLLFLLSSNTTHKAHAQEQIQQQHITADIKVVAAGGGNATAPWTIFVPQNVEIKAGESVTWHNPTKGVAEPHTVTFVLDNNTMAGVVSPLAVSNTTKFMPLPANSNNEPVLLPDKTGNGTNTIISINARTYTPVTIDSQGNVKFMSPNASYRMSGTEKYVNSGWFLPNGLEQQYPGSGNTFTVTFEKPGTYDYICILHPWMTGSVVVK